MRIWLGVFLSILSTVTLGKLVEGPDNTGKKVLLKAVVDANGQPICFGQVSRDLSLSADAPLCGGKYAELLNALTPDGIQIAWVTYAVSGAVGCLGGVLIGSLWQPPTSGDALGEALQRGGLPMLAVSVGTATVMPWLVAEGGLASYLADPTGHIALATFSTIGCAVGTYRVVGYFSGP